MYKSFKQAGIASLIFLLILSASNSYSQGSITPLSISQLSGYPDTAYSQQSFTLVVTLVNLGNDTVFPSDSIKIALLNLDSSVAIPQADIYSGTLGQNLLAGDSVLISISPPYVFDSSHYKVGNNIVVVWPRIGNTIGTTYDSLTLNVVFLLVQSATSILSVNNMISLFPNPVTDKIKLPDNIKNSFEYVRIVSNDGRIVLYNHRYYPEYDIGYLKQGVYIIEVAERSGLLSRKKFIKL